MTSQIGISTSNSDYGGFQGKQDRHCMVADAQRETNATGHESSNQQLEFQSFPNTNLDPLGKTGGYLQLHSFTFLHCTVSIYDHFTPWQLVAVPEMKFLCSRLCCRDIDPNLPNTEYSLEEQFLNLATATSLHGS